MTTEMNSKANVLNYIFTVNLIQCLLHFLIVCRLISVILKKFWGSIPSAKCKVFLLDCPHLVDECSSCAELTQSDKAQTVAEDGCCHLNPPINRAYFSITFSVCLSIISSYLLLVCFLVLSDCLSLSLSLSHTHSTVLWCWQLLAVCTVSVSSALSHPTQPTLSPGNWLSLMGRDGGMNEWGCCKISSVVSQTVRNILAKGTVGCYHRHPRCVGVCVVIMTVCSEDCCSEASVNSAPQKINTLEHTHIHTHLPYNCTPRPKAKAPPAPLYTPPVYQLLLYRPWPRTHKLHIEITHYFWPWFFSLCVL